jgi:WhiB family transcriptional regulator, redox-sensing transcriptional regulator
VCWLLGFEEYSPWLCRVITFRVRSEGGCRAKSLSERFDLSIGKVYATPVTPIAFMPTAVPSIVSLVPPMIANAVVAKPMVPAPQPHLSIVDATWNNLSWRQHASCANLDTNMFFPVGLTGNSIEQTNLAKSICSDCPVAKQCLEFALRTLQDYGVWGGRTEDERRAIRRSRRAAARKAATAAVAAMAESAQADEEQRSMSWQVAGA